MIKKTKNRCFKSYQVVFVIAFIIIVLTLLENRAYFTIKTSIFLLLLYLTLFDI